MKNTDIIICPICKTSVKAQGLNGHLRLLHSVELREMGVSHTQLTRKYLVPEKVKGKCLLKITDIGNDDFQINYCRSSVSDRKFLLYMLRDFIEKQDELCNDLECELNYSKP